MEAEGCVPAELAEEVEARRAELVERVLEVGALGHAGNRNTRRNIPGVAVVDVCCNGTVLPMSLAAAACSSQCSVCSAHADACMR
jgi:hypothetical protein